MKRSENPELAPVIEAVADILQAAEKVLRSFRLYAADHVTVKDFQRQFHEKLTQFLGQHGELSLAVKAYEFLFLGESVYRNTEKQENFSFRLHQDGVRQLTFLEGITDQELKDFIQILRTDFESYEYCDDDAVTLFWKKSFSHISYIIVETFGETAEESEDLEIKIAQTTTEVLADRSLASVVPLFQEGALTNERRIRESDIDEIRNLPELNLARVSQSTLTQATEEGSVEEEELTVQRIVLVLMRVLLGEEDPIEFKTIAAVVRRILESLIRLENFKLAGRIMGKLRELSDPARNPSKVNALLMKKFYEEVNGPDVMEVFQKSLLRVRADQFSDLSAFISTLSDQNAPMAIDLFRRTSNAALRSCLVPALTTIGRDHIDLLSTLLHNSDVELVSSAIDVLVGMGIQKTLPQLKRALHHKTPEVRLRVFDLVAQGGFEYVKNVIPAALSDPSPELRMKALSLIADAKDQKFVKILFDVTRAPTFDEKERSEKMFVYTVLGELAGSAVREVFLEDLKGSIIAMSEGAIERRESAVWGLFSIGDTTARAAVEAERVRKLNPRQVVEACEAALSRWPKERNRGG